MLSPIQLNQEALDGIGALLNHKRYGYNQIAQKMNKNLVLIGLLPNLVEPTPFQRKNLVELIQHYSRLLIAVDGEQNRFAFLPTRTAVAEAQADGMYIADIKKTSARDAYREMKTCFDVIARRMKLELAHDPA